MRIPGVDEAFVVFAAQDSGCLSYGVAAPGTLAGSDRRNLERFRTRPVSAVVRALDDLLAAHRVVADAGFVAVDLYDGSFLYDFAADRLHLIDLDEYRPGPFVVEGDRLPGARSYMAPEELCRGATIDERTTVFDLGRAVLHLLAPPGAGPDGATPPGGAPWRGTAAQRAVVEKAIRREPEQRYGSVAELAAAWRSATGIRLSSGQPTPAFDGKG